MAILLAPPIAFLLYVAILYGVGRIMGRTTRRTQLYAGGEIHPPRQAGPGYRPYFIFALFFAVLHLGALMLASSTPSPTALLYIAGLALSLVALLLG
ncbi:MAG: hypothetical protein KC519_15460 [Anaerolineae bacterium]|nr:hypothetical protein [Anaerolineae bacterium]